MIFITGASGFIGQHLLKALSPRYTVRALVRPDSPRKPVLMPQVQFIEGNVFDENLLENNLSGVKIVVHMAALLRKNNPEDIRRVNLEGTRLLVEAAKKNDVEYIVYLSSENALREDLKDEYAESKRAAEAIIRTFPQYLILRPCFIYGKGDNHGLGRLVSLIQNHKIVPLFGGLKTQTQPMYIDDFVQLILNAIERKIQGEFVIGGPQKVTLNEFLIKAANAQRKKPFFLTLPYLIFYLVAKVCDHLSPSFGWGTVQLENLYKSRTYPEISAHTFAIQPRDVDAGLKSWLGN